MDKPKPPGAAKDPPNAEITTAAARSNGRRRALDVPREVVADWDNRTAVSSVTEIPGAYARAHQALARAEARDNQAISDARAKQTFIRDAEAKMQQRRGVARVNVPRGLEKTAVGVPVSSVASCSLGGTSTSNGQEVDSEQQKQVNANAIVGLTESIISGIPGSHAIAGEYPQHEHPQEEAKCESDSDVCEDVGVVNTAIVVDEEEETTADVKRADHGESDVFEGRIERRQPHGSKRQLFTLLTCILLSGVVALLFLLLIPQSSDSSTKPVELPGFPQPFQEGLPTSVTNALGDVSSPYFWANRWMWNDPFLDEYTQVVQLERFHMVAFYYFTGGINWHRRDNWLTYDVSHCDWYSSSVVEPVCDYEDQLITLNLSSNNLQGDLKELTDQQINHLRIFDISNNSLSGNPPRIGNIAALEVVEISSNNFTFPFASGGVGFGNNIRIMRTDDNRLYDLGDVSSSNLFWFAVPHLEIFNNSANFYSNPLGKDLSFCRNLTSYSTAKNDHIGTIPSEYGRLTKLEEFDIGGNLRMNGTLPSELGLLSKLTSLDLSGTSIAGTIPPRLCERALAGTLDIFANCSLVQCCQ